MSAPAEKYKATLPPRSQRPVHLQQRDRSRARVARGRGAGRRARDAHTIASGALQRLNPAAGVAPTSYLPGMNVGGRNYAAWVIAGLIVAEPTALALKGAQSDRHSEPTVPTSPPMLYGGTATSSNNANGLVPGLLGGYQAP